MKTDNYLNLCLEQAAKSPLRYRHGAIIVHGGKVIGQGYNDHRSGFDGGTLKTGRLPLRSKQGPAVADLKKNHKLKRDSGELEDQLNKTFTPFESMGGGRKLANTPLSMHSEMMAIHSALSASSTLASRAVSFEKPCFKLPSSSKRELRLRREAVESYVKAVCEAALAQSTAGSCHTQSDVQEWRVECPSSGSNESESGVSCQGEEREKSSSQLWQQTQQWATQMQWSTACA
jgi:deoxycytidylate deaminase